MIDGGMEFQQRWERVPTVKKCEGGVLMLERERERLGYKLNYGVYWQICDKKRSRKIRLFSPHLGVGNGTEWKWMKRIILEYSSLLLFGSFIIVWEFK